MHLKKKIIGGVFILMILAGGYYIWFRPKPVEISTERVKRGDVVETVSVTGQLVPKKYSDLSFSVTGSVQTVYVTENEQVKQGDPLIKLDRSVLDSQLRASQVALRIAEENEKLARRDRTFWKSLKPEGKAMKKLTTEQARENVRTIQNQIELTVLRAPFDGWISRLDIREGEGVTPGRVVIRIVGDKDLGIESRVPESDIAKIHSGMVAKLDLDALSRNEKFFATVNHIDPAATLIQGVVAYRVVFSLEQSDPRFKEGMTTNIEIETDKRENVLTLPFRALSREKGSVFVEVKRDNNTFEKRVVTTGLEGDEGTIEILSGLSEGEEVAIGARQVK